MFGENAVRRSAAPISSGNGMEEILKDFQFDRIPPHQAQCNGKPSLVVSRRSFAHIVHAK
jgi:hypothetical protein